MAVLFFTSLIRRVSLIISSNSWGLVLAQDLRFLLAVYRGPCITKDLIQFSYLQNLHSAYWTNSELPEILISILTYFCLGAILSSGQYLLLNHSWLCLRDHAVPGFKLGSAACMVCTLLSSYLSSAFLKMVWELIICKLYIHMYTYVWKYLCLKSYQLRKIYI